MKPLGLVITISIPFICGLLTYIYFQGWIIIQFPNTNVNFERCLFTPLQKKKKMKLIFWCDDNWVTEEAELIWQDQINEVVYYLINNLLTLMYEEDALSKKVSVESVMISDDREAFISFNRNLFRKESSIFEKWTIVESILKTIHENEIAVRAIRFLVHHKPLEDYHLDFSRGWSISHTNVSK